MEKMIEEKVTASVEAAPHIYWRRSYWNKCSCKIYTSRFNKGAFANKAQNKVIAAVESQFELQVESQKEERRFVASAEAAVRNLVSNFVPCPKSFWQSAFENEAENKVIVDVERQAELQDVAQKERKVIGVRASRSAKVGGLHAGFSLAKDTLIEVRSNEAMWKVDWLF